MHYRPVSILIIFSSIYEKAVSVQLADYFIHIFFSLLSDFCKGYSCQSTLLEMIENFKCAFSISKSKPDAFERGEYIACISMDINKVFDELICKLHVYGLSSNTG